MQPHLRIVLGALVALASCTADDRTVEVQLTACADTDPTGPGSCATCTVDWPVPTQEGDPTAPDGYDPEDDTPLTPETEPSPELGETAVADLAAALGQGGLARGAAPDPYDVDVDGPTGMVVIEDAPGCNGYPDTVCTTHCCALHDICYDKNNCTWLSWCGLESAACTACNTRVAACILRWGLFGCQLGDPKPCSTWKCGCDKHECYDARTKKHYCAASC